MRTAIRSTGIALGLAFFAAGASGAEESSNFEFDLVTGTGGAERGRVRWTFGDASADFGLRVWNLAAERDYDLHINDVADPVARFTTDPRGAAELEIDLLGPYVGTQPIPDPRGVAVYVAEPPPPHTVPGMVVGAPNVFLDPQFDPPGTRLLEKTSLPRVHAVAGAALATYSTSPNREQRLDIELSGVVAGDYSISFEGGDVHSVTPDALGMARLQLRSTFRRSRGGTGFRRAHRRTGPLVGNPRSATIEVVRDGEVQFAGPMRARIPGVNVCGPSANHAELESEPSLPSASGEISFGYESDCDLHLELSVTLPAGDYDVLIGDLPSGHSQGNWFTVPDEGDGVGSAMLVLEAWPDPGEIWIPAEAGTGKLLRIVPLAEEAAVLWGALP